MKSRHDGSKEAQITPGRLTRLQVLVVTLFSSAIKQLESGLCCEGSRFKYFGKAYYGREFYLRQQESLRSATMTSNEKEICQPAENWKK